MKKLVMLFILMLFTVGCSNTENKKFTVGIIQWAEHPALDDARIGLEEKLADKDVSLVYKNANEDGSVANMIVSQFVEDNVDLIYAIATPAAQSAVNGVLDESIPIVFNAVFDPVDAGLVNSLEDPQRNVTGVSDLAPIDRQLGLIKEFIPEALSVGVLYNTSEANSLLQVNLVEDLIKNHNMTLNTKGISDNQDISLAATQLSDSSDAIYIITDNMVAKATSLVVSIANEANIPVFMAEAGQFEFGILASDSISYLNLGKQAGDMVIDILFNNKKASEISVEISKDTQLFVSEEVANNLKIEIPQSILERAILK